MTRRHPWRAPEWRADRENEGAPPSRAADGGPSGSGRAPLDASALRGGGWGKVSGMGGNRGRAGAGRRRIGRARRGPPAPLLRTLAPRTAIPAMHLQSKTPPPPPPKGAAAPGDRTAVDVLAGALARALSQSTIHPLDTLKVRMQAPPGALSKFGKLVPPPGGRRPRWTKRALLRHGVRYRNKTAVALSLKGAAAELGSLYRGVFGAASGAGVIIGTYFAFYSTAKRQLAIRTDMSPGAVAFAAGAAAAVGSSVVKVPLAVCIRSVQAGVYSNVFSAASQVRACGVEGVWVRREWWFVTAAPTPPSPLQITRAVGARGLFTGFVPTLLEDVPDMGVKFAVYESLRGAHAAFFGGRPPTVAEDLLYGGAAGAAAAAATTPLDVLKTGMMVSAASRPSLASALRGVLAAAGPAGLFAGVGPRALSNGLNSAVFFCFFEAIRGTLREVVVEREAAAAARLPAAPRGRRAKAAVLG